MVGQAGKTLDATPRTLEALNASGSRVTFRNLATDTFTFSITLGSLTAAGSILPQLGQTVTLKRGASNFFQGVVTGLRQTGWRIDVTVSGPWWWFERIALESTQTDASGAAGDRASFAHPSQSLTTSLNDLLTEVYSLGVPGSIGSLATTFTAPVMKINQGSFAQAIAEVVRVTPDMVLYFDYSGSAPVLKTERRLTGLAAGSAAGLTLDARTVADFELNPLTELEVVGVRVPYLTRATNGAKKFARQTAGTTVVGKVLLHTVSGDEMDTFLPNDLLDYVDVQTINTGATPSIDHVIYFDSTISKIAQQYGVQEIGLTTPYVTLWDSPTVAGGTGPKIAQPVDTPIFKLENGAQLFPSGDGLLITGSLPEWAMRQLGAQKVTVKGTIYGYFAVQYGTAAVFTPAQQALRAGAVVGKDWATQITPSTPLASSYYWYRRAFDFTATLMPSRYAALTRIYRESDYGFRVPPAGFAAGLLAAQNYIPYEGRCTVVEDDAGSTRYINKALSFSNSQTAHASLRAMVTEETVEIGTGKTSIYMGPPARFSFLELVNKMRTNSNDQITYL